MKFNRPLQWLLRVAVVAAFAAAVWWALSLQVGVQCEVCMRVGYVVQCSHVAGPTREEAVAAASRHACGIIAGGMTEELACQRRAPERTHCSAVRVGD